MRVILLSLALGLLLVVGCAPQHELSLVADGEGEVSGAGRYEEGASVNLTATPEEGWKLTGWEIEGEVISEKEDFTYTMPAEEVTIKAQFKELYTLNVVSTDPSRGTVSGEGEYVEGEKVEIIAHPEEGFELFNWKAEGEVISEEESFTYTMPPGHVTIEGFFQREPLLSIDYFDEDSGWDLLQKYGEARFENGRIILSWTDSDRYLSRATFSDVFTDLILEVDVEYVDGHPSHSQQIGIRRNMNTSEAYRFTITPCGHFWVTLQDEDGDTTLLHKHTKSQHIAEKGKNKVRIEVVGEEMRFFVNNQLLIEITDDTYEKGTIAFYVGFGAKGVEYAESAFSNFVVRKP